MQSVNLFRIIVLAVLAIAVIAEYDDSAYAGVVPVAVDLDYFSNYVKKGGPQGPMRFGKRRGPSGPLRFGKRSFHAVPEDVASWYQ